MYDWDIDDVIDLENSIAMWNDLQEAMEADHKREEAAKNPPKLPPGM